MAKSITVEVVFGLPDEQALDELQLNSGATVADAIAESGLARRFPEQDLEALDAGIWGRLVPRDRLLKDGDRVGLYRPLVMDPRDARRLKASRVLK